MTQDNDRRIYLPPPPPQIVTPATRPPQRVERFVEGTEDIEEELVELPPKTQKELKSDPNYIPELEITPEQLDEDFGTGEKLDGSLDEMERTDVGDVLEIGDLNSIFGTDAPKKKRLFRRTTKKYTPPSTSLGGFRSWE